MALFDEAGRPAAPGAVGEICLSGSQLTRGYWQQPELDADRFRTVEGTRWYRTGDLGRLEAGDGLHFLGRVDHQIKIRGYRVETLEIEGALRAAAGRDLVAVLPLPAADGTVAGVVGFVAGAPLDTAAVRARLQGCLPDYMIPQAVIVLDALPLNTNGKVDLRALAEISNYTIHGRSETARHGAA
ncbi:Dimodular nonribosomal peptide synthase [Methylobacterium dankookense]|uniref:Dimodular nonribosomal peptide synthase n=2 Tax=Methylobacterium dankookense TaxID=560405 RepID=A0A564G3W3_9HYPH|nr:Dimodular nonribosomal peptide synthase [Methylobacterium dankookense]